ncbi:class I SAM-dependent methyltransferase [Fructobacillus sp. M1-13]|uniref:Class I SAM-dependent methyltransferase n=1 Tax=Fructobacillus papyriferae TaxID=2713171 RepID=A0ABS5QPJ8_9LACO|nr:class I SAM-dependent methyltransferase [Fructobacillus papyriferae]MBS9335093.1 class I SAM-dependent methyltransferase [Fructobacillus papyriferae]MCD2159421.1 class I SAM-dependent methyltransferase [Fructobacillus papyriferae]
MTKVNIPEQFTAINEVVNQVKANEQVNQRQALVQVLSTLNEQEITEKDKEILSADSQLALKGLFSIKWSAFSFQEKRHLLQLLILKADKDDQLPANDQLTPDGIGYLVGDLVAKTAKLEKANGQATTITDLAVGSANLLWTVQEVLQAKKAEVKTTGIDIAEPQLALASVSADLLQDNQADFFLGDVVSLPEGELLPSDVVIGDLPIGYYPGEAPKGMVTAFQDGKSYAHFLMIEKAIDLLKDDGWAYLVVPADILSGEKRESILKLFAQKAQLKAFLTLPASFFQQQNQQKALLVIRKNGAKPKTEVMLGQYPSVKESQALEEFLQDLSDWGKLNKEKA